MIHNISSQQDTRPQIKPPPAKLQVNKIGLDLKEGKTSSTKIVQGTGKLEELSTTKVRVIERNISPNSKLELVDKELNTKEGNFHEDLIRTSRFETSSAAEGMTYQHRHQSLNDSDKQSSGGSSIVEESQSQSSTIGGASSHDFLRSVADCEDTDDSFLGSAAWIFPDQIRRFCVTTGGKKLMDFVGGYSVKLEIQEKKMNFSISEKVC